jgi:hypothetical protein
VEKGHPNNQSLAKTRSAHNSKIKKGMMRMRQTPWVASISTSTSKDYFLQDLKVNFAGF